MDYFTEEEASRDRTTRLTNYPQNPAVPCADLLKSRCLTLADYSRILNQTYNPNPQLLKANRDAIYILSISPI